MDLKTTKTLINNGYSIFTYWKFLLSIKDEQPRSYNSLEYAKQTAREWRKIGRTTSIMKISIWPHQGKKQALKHRQKIHLNSILNGKSYKNEDELKELLNIFLLGENTP